MSNQDPSGDRIDDATVQADEQDAAATHRADREPTPEEEAAAESNPPLDPESAEAYRDAIERGAHVKGEGQIEG